MDALPEQFLEGLGEVVEEQGAQAALCGIYGLSAHQAIDVGSIAADEFIEDVDAEVACGAGYQDVAQLLALARTEEA